MAQAIRAVMTAGNLTTCDSAVLVRGISDLNHADSTTAFLSGLIGVAEPHFRSTSYLNWSGELLEGVQVN
jgi:hypothetical protein